MEDMAAWFAHPVYSRYWQHYQQAMRWQQRSRQAYRKALDAAYGPAYPDPYPHQHHQRYDPYPQHHQRYDPYHRPPDSHRRYADWQCGGGGGREERASAGAPVEGAGQISEEEEEELDSAGGSTSDSEIECDVSSMEITDELRQYFAQTEQHRTELKEQQQREAAELESYVLADRDMHAACRLSALPPSDRPGERRSAEMRKLYGENAAKIQGMETAMQLTFDRNCDRKQPKYWPVIPLKL